MKKRKDVLLLYEKENVDVARSLKEHLSRASEKRYFWFIPASGIDYVHTECLDDIRSVQEYIHDDSVPIFIIDTLEFDRVHENLPFRHDALRFPFENVGKEEDLDGIREEVEKFIRGRREY